MSSKIIRVLGAVAMLLASLDAFGGPPRILLLTGQNNHDWRATTPVLKQILETDGRFVVDVTTNVPALKPDIFARYDALLSNFNTFGQKHPGPVWDQAMRKAFEDYVHSGHGFIAVHAGSSEFYDWPAFQEIGGANWGKGTTGHGKMHTNAVHLITPAHPITAGLNIFETFDEFWQNTEVAPGAVALAAVTPKKAFGGSGKPEPIAFVTNYGQGRGFTLLLGHNTRGMESDGFKALLCRGAEWAATGKVLQGNRP